MTPSALSAAARDDGRAYLFDMISELAKLAERMGEVPTAILLEAVLAAAQAAHKGRSP